MLSVISFAEFLQFHLNGWRYSSCLSLDVLMLTMSPMLLHVQVICL